MPACSVRVIIDGQEPEDVRLTNLVVNNTRHLGNFDGFRGASLHDGRADVQLAKNSFGQQVLQNMGLLTRTHLWARGQYASARLPRCA
jgi:diacylglycerol kinase family enzyme